MAGVPADIVSLRRRDLHGLTAGLLEGASAPAGVAADCCHFRARGVHGHVSGCGVLDLAFIGPGVAADVAAARSADTDVHGVRTDNVGIVVNSAADPADVLAVGSCDDHVCDR